MFISATQIIYPHPTPLSQRKIITRPRKRTNSSQKALRIPIILNPIRPRGCCRLTLPTYHNVTSSSKPVITIPRIHQAPVRVIPHLSPCAADILLDSGVCALETEIVPWVGCLECRVDDGAGSIGCARLSQNLAKGLADRCGVVNYSCD